MKTSFNTRNVFDVAFSLVFSFNFGINFWMLIALCLLENTVLTVDNSFLSFQPKLSQNRHTWFQPKLTVWPQNHCYFASCSRETWKENIVRKYGPWFHPLHVCLLVFLPTLLWQFYWFHPLRACRTTSCTPPAVCQRTHGSSSLASPKTIKPWISSTKPIYIVWNS